MTEPHVQRNLRLPASLWERLERHVPKGQRSEFVRQAIEERLEALETRARLEVLEGEMARLRARVEGGP